MPWVWIRGVPGECVERLLTGGHFLIKVILGLVACLCDAGDEVGVGDCGADARLLAFPRRVAVKDRWYRMCAFQGRDLKRVRRVEKVGVAQHLEAA